MKNGHELSIGDRLGGHYEVLQVVGNDNFETLYLVKDLHMADQKFMLKELFRVSYPLGEDEHSTHVRTKIKEGFEKRKQELIAEVEILKGRRTALLPKVYGYFEENNTIYTIMEFLNSSNLSDYLKISEKKSANEIMIEEEESHLDALITPFQEMEEASSAAVAKPEVKKEKRSVVESEKPKSRIFLKLLIVGVLLLLGLLYYSYDMIQKDKERAKNRASEASIVTDVVSEPIKHPTLTDKIKELREENRSTLVEVEKKESLVGASYIEEGDISAPPKIEDFSEVPKAEIVDELEESDRLNALEERIYTQEEAAVIEVPVIYEPNIVETPLPDNAQPNVSLGTRIN